MTDPDLIYQEMRRQREAIQNARWLIGTVEFACVSVPILLALILWRVW